MIRRWSPWRSGRGGYTLDPSLLALSSPVATVDSLLSAVSKGVLTTILLRFSASGNMHWLFSHSHATTVAYYVPSRPSQKNSVALDYLSIQTGKFSVPSGKVWGEVGLVSLFQFQFCSLLPERIGANRNGRLKISSHSRCFCWARNLLKCIDTPGFFFDLKYEKDFHRFNGSSTPAMMFHGVIFFEVVKSNCFRWQMRFLYYHAEKKIWTLGLGNLSGRQFEFAMRSAPTDCYSPLVAPWEDGPCTRYRAVLPHELDVNGYPEPKGGKLTIYKEVGCCTLSWFC